MALEAESTLCRFHIVRGTNKCIRIKYTADLIQYDTMALELESFFSMEMTQCDTGIRRVMGRIDTM